MGKIDAKKATDVQTLLNEGRVEEAAALLGVRKEELESAERMQTERAGLEREVAAGEVTIDGVRTKTLEAGRLELEEALTNAQLDTLYRSEQGQSIANLLAIMNTLPEGSAERQKVEDAIASAVETGIANDALADTITNMLDVSKTVIGGGDGAQITQEQRQREEAAEDRSRQQEAEEEWVRSNPPPKGYGKRADTEEGGWQHGVPKGEGWQGGGNPGYKPKYNADALKKWNRRVTEFADWENRRQIFLDSI
jgi:hypothetical protein